jgi:hypothetical protein
MLRIFKRLPCISSIQGLFISSVKFSRYNLVGGDEENRTPDPLLARQVLSQLSYAPNLCNYLIGGPKWT